MTNPDEDAKNRKLAAETRMRSASRIRGVGSNMMVAGGVALGIVITAFALESQIPSGVRSTALTMVVLLWLGGMGFYVGGQSQQLNLGQAADDREELEASRREVYMLRHEVYLLQQEVVTLKAVMSRPGAADANAAVVELAEGIHQHIDQALATRDDAFVDALSKQEDGQETNGHKVARLVRSRDHEWPKKI